MDDEGIHCGNEALVLTVAIVTIVKLLSYMPTSMRGRPSNGDGYFLQAAANLTNTYFDFIKGVDNKDNAAAGTGEKTLVEQKISTHGLITFAIALYIIALVSISPLLLRCWPTLVTFVCGTFSQCFIPLHQLASVYRPRRRDHLFMLWSLLCSTSLILTGELNNELNIYSIVGLLTEGILHANNARDIKSDTLAGATTLATIIGFKNSYYLYVALLVGAFTSAAYISFIHHFGCALTLLTIPLAMDLEKRFREKNLTG